MYPYSHLMLTYGDALYRSSASSEEAEGGASRAVTARTYAACASAARAAALP
jgi:hypothetical protein